jgi:outer membrane immunogenic protein
VSWLADPSFAGDFSGKDSGTETGWTIGGGLEHKWSQRLSTKLEYLFVDLDTSRVRLTDPQFPDDFIDYKFDHSFHVVRVGLNFSFGGGAHAATPEPTSLK